MSASFLRWARPLRLLGALALVSFSAVPAPAAPQVFWASDPVGPGETVLIQGSDLGGAAVEVARLEDGDPGPARREVGVTHWTRVRVLQGSDQALKFALPAGWKPGVFACRLTGGGTSAPVLLNAPDPWWLQGDQGPAASPGGWLRVLGKCLGPGRSGSARLEPAGGKALPVRATAGDGFSVRFDLPADLKPGLYTVRVHNGGGGPGAWRDAGRVRVQPPPAWPARVFNVLDFYGKDAKRQARETLGKYRPVPDRTAGLRAALQKARENGGGVVYFPAGRYGIRGEVAVPPRTVLKGEGTGLVVLWWGAGRFNLDGGGSQGLARDPHPAKPPATLLSGRDFGLEDMSLYFPLDHQTGIAAAEGFRMRRVRIRVDHLWARDGDRRPEGTIARLGDRFEVTDCDIEAKGTGLVPGRYGLIARNTVRAGKCNCPLGGSREVIVEDNRFVSTYPTAYQNIAGVARDLYYARNRHEARAAHQADYSFTFDAGGAAYLGKVSAVAGRRLTLAGDPTFPRWAPEVSPLWRQAVVCIQDGRGAGQWRDVTSHRGRVWEVDRPFDCPPDRDAVVTIVPMNGRVLVVGNRFEDANWVNAGYGTAIDVVFAGNRLYRCAQLLNYGLAERGACLPCWYVQYLGNQLHEGHTTADTTGAVRPPGLFRGAVTRCTVHRRTVLGRDTSGGVRVGGRARDVLVEGCVLGHPQSSIRAEGEARGVLFRDNRFADSPRYEGEALREAVVLPTSEAPARQGR